MKQGIAVAAGHTLSLDTYFNSFFESQWRRHTGLAALALQLDLTGDATLRIYRRALGRKTLIAQMPVSPGCAPVPIPSNTVNFRQHGVLGIEITATGAAATVHGGAWLGVMDTPRPVSLAAIFCTHNREADLAACLTALAANPADAASLARIFVVNQGRPGLLRVPEVNQAATRLGGKLTVIEQANRGGAGGFTRGLIAALDEPSLTHVVMLDDDIQIETGSLSRMAAFFAGCRDDLVVGGNMLDLLHPTLLYEAGAKITARHWAFQPERHGVDLGRPDSLEALSHPVAVHYNGWWCCGIPLALLRQHGLPLPCFIRGDDVEFGLRLSGRGVATVPLPGIAVWHAPFYLKLGSWQTYYETRNMLVSASLHLPISRSGLLRRIARQVVQALLTYRYYSVALMLDGIGDFLAGPGILHGDPLPRHAMLARRRAEYPEVTISRDQVLEEQRHGAVPKSAAACLLLMVRLTIRNAVAADPVGPPSLVPANDISWIGMRGLDNFVLQSWWDEARPVLRRSRAAHRSLLRRAVPLLVRLYREGPAAAATWRQAAPSLTSMPFWRDYLGLPSDRPAELRRQAAE